MAAKVWTTANIVTVVRICFTPVIALLPFIDGYWPKLICFVVFVLVAFTDMLDGYLARSPIYWISRERQAEYGIPVWGSIPLWATLLMIGREVAMTVFRQWAKAKGVVIAAGNAGKLKAVFQNIFVGAVILWFAFRDARKPLGWEGGVFR